MAAAHAALCRNHPTGFDLPLSIRRRNPTSQPRTPARKSSIAVLSGRLFSELQLDRGEPVPHLGSLRANVASSISSANRMLSRRSCWATIRVSCRCSSARWARESTLSLVLLGPDFELPHQEGKAGVFSAAWTEPLPTSPAAGETSAQAGVAVLLPNPWNLAVNLSQSMTRLPPVASCCFSHFMRRSRQAWSMCIKSSKWI